MKSRYRPIRLDVGFQDFLLWSSLGGREGKIMGVS